MTAMLSSPLKWKGGKSSLREVILPLIDRVPHETYGEPFVGAGWIILGKRPRGGEFINDAEGELTNLYTVIAESVEVRERLCYTVGMTPHSRAVYDRWNQVDPDTLDPFKRAVRFMILNRMTWRGATVLNRVGGAPGVDLDLDGAAPSRFGEADDEIDNTAARLRKMGARFARVHIENGDFEPFVRFLDKEDTLFYCDPPYLGTSGYNTGFTLEDHGRLAALLRDLKGRYILSINDSKEVRMVYGALIKGHHCRPVTTKRSLQTDEEGDTAKELLIGNVSLDPPKQVSFFDMVAAV